MDGVAQRAKTDVRKLRDLAGIGPSIEANLRKLNIRTVPELADADAEQLYRKLSDIEGRRQDPCVLDTFRCAIAQARDPQLAREKRNWWWWSRQRKAAS